MAQRERALNAADAVKTRTTAFVAAGLMSVAVAGSVFSAANPPAPGLADGLRVAEEAWTSTPARDLRLTNGAEVTGTLLGDGDATIWSVPSIGRIAVGERISIGTANAAQRDLVVTGIGIVDDASLALAHADGQIRSLLLTLRSKADEGGQPIRLLVSGTPLIVAPTRGADKAL